MPFLGHHPAEGLDVSPDNTPAVEREADAITLARGTVQRFATGPDDEHMLLDLLGLLDPSGNGADDAPLHETAMSG